MSIFNKVQLTSVFMMSLSVIAAAGHLTWQEWDTYAEPMRWFSIIILCFYSLTATVSAWKLHKLGDN